MLKNAPEWDGVDRVEQLYKILCIEDAVKDAAVSFSVKDNPAMETLLNAVQTATADERG